MGLGNNFKVVISARMSLSVLDNKHTMLLGLSKSFKCFYIDNRNTKEDCFSRDCLHLTEREKCYLANNLIFNPNSGGLF